MLESTATGSLVALCRPIPAAVTAPPSPVKAGGKSVPSPKSSSPMTSPPLTASKAASGGGNNMSPATSPGSRAASGGGIFPSPNCKCVLAHAVTPFLDERSLVALMRTSKRFKEITTSDEVWEGRLKDMRVNVILVNRVSNFFRAFRSEIVTLRGLEGCYDFESEESESGQAASAIGGASNVTSVRRVMLTIAPAFLGFVTPVARVVLIVQYFGMNQQDVFEGTMRYSFPKRLFVMSTHLTRAPRQEGPRFQVVVARSMRKWGTQKPSHFDTVKGGTRLIISIAQAAQSPANGYLPTNELLTVSRIPRDGENVSAAPLPMEAVGGGSSGGGGSSNNGGAGSNASSSNPPSEKRFSLRAFLSGGK